MTLELLDCLSQYNAETELRQTDLPWNIQDNTTRAGAWTRLLDELCDGTAFSEYFLLKTHPSAAQQCSGAAVFLLDVMKSGS